MYYYTGILSLHSISPPADFEKTIADIFEDVVNTTVYAPFLPTCYTLMSVVNTGKVDDLLATLPSHHFDRFIHLFHHFMFIKRLESEILSEDDEIYSVTPVTDAVKALLTTTDISTTVSALSIYITDVLTAHPVDMDRGLVINHKRRLAQVHQWWVAHKKAYPHIQDVSVKLAARAQLNDFSGQIRDGLFQLIYTENYRKVKIKPESEQRTLSRAIKDNERKVISHWSTLVRVVQFVLLEAIMDALITQYPHLNAQFAALYGLSRTAENLKLFWTIAEIKSHPDFDTIMTLDKRLKYKLEVWRGDMDGNPFVTGQTVALSMAYGRKRSFERLSADNAVIRYCPQTTAFGDIETEISKRLVHFKKTGELAWKRYIKEREAEKWTPVQIYSGLMYYRMVELTEAAELYTRTMTDTDLLCVGFKTKADFLRDTDVLEAAERESGLQKGTWTLCRRLVNLRGLALGRPHLRKGEAFHLRLLEELVPGLKEADAVVAKKKILLSFKQTIDLPPTSDLRELLQNYLDVMRFDPACTLVQSDSGVNGDVELSILIIKAISKIIGHTGKVTVLCEDRQSMELAITLMAQASDHKELFKDVIMMCAGSDNQKKMGPFYSAYLNHLFLKTARDNGIPSFFGVGDSPLRSSAFDPQCTLKTFQPGSRKQFFFSDRIYGYLSHRLAHQLSHIANQYHVSPQVEATHTAIAKALGECMFGAYIDTIYDRLPLHHAIQSISEIVTTYFSRPSKKYGAQGYILDQIRAIDCGRAQLILNTFDPQLSGILDGLTRFKDVISTLGISTDDTYDFFNRTAFGQGILKTLAYFATQLDDTLPTATEIRSVSAADIAVVYEALSGKPLSVKTDPYLRASRLIWHHVSTTEDKRCHQAVAMMLFGSNWMI